MALLTTTKRDGKLMLARVLCEIEANESNHTQRDKLVAHAMALAKELGYTCGVLFEPHMPTWSIWCIDLPGVGEVSWYCPTYVKRNDTDEKYRRCRAYVAATATTQPSDTKNE